MKYVMNYLKKPFENKYIIDDYLDLEILAHFKYFKWIKIKTTKNNKLSNGTIIQLTIGSLICQEYMINSNTIFDTNNYYKFDIDFPNKFLYSYHSLGIKIIKKNYNENNLENLENLENFNIIVCGCDLLSTTPKMFSNSNIIFDHDFKWYVKGEKEFLSISGVVCDRLRDKSIKTTFANTNTNTNTNTNNSSIELFKKFQNKNLVQIFDMELPFENGKKETCIFINDNLQNSDLNNTNIQSMLFFLIDKNFMNYLQTNNLKQTELFSVGSDEILKKNANYDLCEVLEKSLLKLSYIIPRTSDMIKHFDIIIKNLKSKSDKYKISAWIEYESNMMYDFGLIQIENENGNVKKIRLTPSNNKIINRLRASENMYLIIQIPDSKLSEWKCIDISYGTIFSDTNTRKNLASLYKYNDVKIL